MLEAYLRWTAALDSVLQFGDQSSAKALALRPEPIRWLAAMRLVESQVFNGGFCAVYYNYYFDFIPDALAGYRGMGAHRQAEILQRVVDSVPPERWHGPNAAWPHEYPMPKLSEEELNTLAKEWYTLNQDTTDDLKARFVLSRPDVFEVE